jgi:acetoin utilization deacetylase AcuC-like enzyme
MKVSDQGYALMTDRLTRLGAGRCVAALEGGYGLTSTASAAASTLSSLLGFAAEPLSSRRRPKRSSVELLSKVVEAHKEYWPAGAYTRPLVSSS